MPLTSFPFETCSRLVFAPASFLAVMALSMAMRYGLALCFRGCVVCARYVLMASIADWLSVVSVRGSVTGIALRALSMADSSA